MSRVLSPHTGSTDRSSYTFALLSPTDNTPSAHAKVVLKLAYFALCNGDGKDFIDYFLANQAKATAPAAAARDVAPTLACERLENYFLANQAKATAPATAAARDVAPTLACERLETHHWLVVLSGAQKDIAGFANFDFREGGQLIVYHLLIAPEHRRKGLATRVLRTLESVFGRLLTLAVDSCLTLDALQFCARRGMAIDPPPLHEQGDLTSMAADATRYLRNADASLAEFVALFTPCIRPVTRGDAFWFTVCFVSPPPPRAAAIKF